MEAQVKECKQCKEVKLLSEYHNSKTSKDGRVSKCKQCAKLNRHLYYIENRDKYILQAKEWAAGNKGKRSAYNREYYRNNKEKKADYNRTYGAKKRAETSLKRLIESNKREVMKINSNEQFQVLAKIKGLEFRQFNELIIKELSSNNIYLEEEDKGVKLWEVLRTHDTCIDSLIVPIMGHTNLNFAFLFAELQVFGNGDCEACGGEIVQYKEEENTAVCEHCDLIYPNYE